MKKTTENKPVCILVLTYLFLFTYTVAIKASEVKESKGKVNGDVYGQVKVIGDVDGDGIKDLVFGATDGKIHLYSSSGHEIFRPPYWPAQLDAPILTDVEVTSSTDGSMHILATTMSGALFCLNSKGKTVWANTDACNSESKDIDAIDAVRTSAPVLVPSEDGSEVVYFSTSNGRVLEVQGGITSRVYDVGGATEGPPALADINKDGQYDIVMKNNHGKVVVVDTSTHSKKMVEWDAHSKSNNGKWPFGIDARDVTGDGIPEIITTAPGNGSTFSMWTPDGKKLTEFGLSAGAHSAPQVADIDGDGVDDFIIAQSDGKVLVCDKKGNPKEGWPYQTSVTILCAPQLVDMDGDGYPEIVFTGSNVNGKDESSGCVIALDRKGKMLEDFPKYVGKTYAKPTFADIDGDGKLEMIVAGGIGYTGPQIHIFRTETKYNTKIAVLFQETIYK